MEDFIFYTEKVISNFLKKINKTSTCWIWKACVYGNNKYGKFWDGKNQSAAHRFSFRYFKGKIPKEKVVMHSCNNPLCVNPEHLSLGTQKENIQYAWSLNRYTDKNGNRLGVSKSVCKNGHDISTKQNRYFFPNGIKSECKQCRKNRRKVN